MSNDLNYLSLRAVLEYLDPNKRNHIAARSPAIRDFERSIPIHFNHLGVIKDGFQSNNIVIQLISGVQLFRRNNPIFTDDDLNLFDGEIFFGSEQSMRKHEFMYISFKKQNSRGVERQRRLPNDLDIQEASRILARRLLGYKNICTNCLKFGSLHGSVVRTPANTKILTKVLDINDNDLEHCLKLVDGSSFPLNQFALIAGSVQALSHPLAQTSERLVICESKIALNLDVLQRLPNKHVEVHSIDFTRESILRLIQQWDRGIGKSFLLRVSCEAFVENILEEINKKLGGEFRSLPHFPSCVTIPLNETSELNIHGFNKNKMFMFKIEENPIGTSLPLTDEERQLRSENANLERKFYVIMILIALYYFVVFILFVFGYR